jgi:hypothetical protein
MVKPPIIAFILAIIAIMGGIYLADQAGLINITPGPDPRADSLWEVTFLPTSDTDRTEAGEAIGDNGRTITYTLADAQMDGLGDLNLDVRVINLNIGATDERWAFRADLTFVSTTQASGAPGAQPIANLTDYNSRTDITWSLTDSGAPSLAQVGQYATSSDWVTGASDTLNIDITMNPTATDDISSALPGKLEFLVGGIKMTCNLLEG